MADYLNVNKEMTDNTVNNKRIVRNTGLLYFRMIILMFVSLYTSRIVLNALGVEDFGIYNVVAGFVSMLAFFSSSISNASQRYLSIGLGKNNILETTIAFKQSLTLMIIFSGVVLVFGETIGLFFVRNKLVIPPQRLSAALWIYQFALISTLCSINQVTFSAAIVAREKMGIYAYLGIFEAVARLSLAFLLRYNSSVDSLVLFGLLTALVSAITFLFHIAYCVLKFPEAKCHVCWNKRLVKEMSQFIGANLFGGIAWSAGVQGTNIILNLFFGPVVNAARGIAVQVTSVVARFTDNVMTAMKPQIIKSYVVGDMDYMKSLIIKSTKYISIISTFLAIPIIFEAHRVLKIWLGQVPDYTVVFIRLVLIEQMINVLVLPLWIAANATGRINKNQVYGRLFTLAALPISYLLLLFYKDPIVPMVVLIVSAIGYWLYCLVDIKNQIALDVKEYLKKSILPSFSFMLLLVVTNEIIVAIYQVDNIMRLTIVCLVTLIAGFAGCYLILDHEEKIFIKKLITDKR